MSIVTFRIEDSILSKLNARTNQRSNFIREAIIEKLEDLEDLEAFEKTKDDKVYSLSEVRKNLGLAN